MMAMFGLARPYFTGDQIFRDKSIPPSHRNKQNHFKVTRRAQLLHICHKLTKLKKKADYRSDSIHHNLDKIAVLPTFKLASSWQRCKVLGNSH